MKQLFDIFVVMETVIENLWKWRLSMNLKRMVLLITIIMVMLVPIASTSFADESEYGTMTWVTRDGIARVTLTGIVGVQLDEITTDIAWLEDYGDNSLLSLDYDNILSSLESTRDYNIIPVVDGATLTIELINGGYKSTYGTTIFATGAVRDRRNLYEAEVWGDDVFTYKFKYEEGISFVANFLHSGEGFVLDRYDTNLYYDELIYTKVISEQDAKVLMARKKAEIDSGVGYESASSWAVKELQAAEVQYMSASSMSNNFTQNATRKEFAELVIQLPKLLASPYESDEQLLTESEAINRALLDRELTWSELSDSQIVKANLGNYADVHNNDPAITSAAKYGIINGFVVNKKAYFNPKGDITREELCTMIVRALKVSGVNLDTAIAYAGNYSDLSEISSWAEESMRILNGYGIYKGNGIELMPKDTVERQTAILICYRAFKAFSGEVLDGKLNNIDADYIMGRLNEDYVRVEAEDLPEGFLDYEISFSLATGDYTVRSGDFILENAPKAKQVTISYSRGSEFRGLSSAYDGLMGVSINGEIKPVRFPVTGNSDATIGEITLTVNINEGDTFKIVSIPNGEELFIDYVDFYTSTATNYTVLEGYGNKTVKNVSLLNEVVKPASASVRYEAEHEANIYGGLAQIQRDNYYSDNTFVEGIPTEGAFFSINNCPASETMTIAYDNYGDGNVDSILSIYINGIKSARVKLPNRTPFNVFEETTVNLSIPEMATVSLQWDIGDIGDISLDYIDFYGEGLLTQDEAFAKAKELVPDTSEAAATVVGGKVVIVPNKDVKGTIIEGESTQNITVGLPNIFDVSKFEAASIVDIPEGGKALSKFTEVKFIDCPSARYITIRFSSEANMLEEIMLYVDGKHIGELVFSDTGRFAFYDEITFAIDIKEGSEVMIRHEGWLAIGLNIDYIEFHD